LGVFALFGQQILLYLGIRLPSLKAAGGLLLLVVALDLLRGEVEGLSGESQVNIALVPLGTRLLAGPGAIAAIMVFMREASTAPERVGVALGLASVLIVLWLTLRFAGVVSRVIEQPGIELVTRISGLLLTAIAGQLVADAVREFIREAYDRPPA
jgi:multiple antibiotic resistance protein